MHLQCIGLALASFLFCPEAVQQEVHGRRRRRPRSHTCEESAIVVIDMQNDFAHPKGKLSAGGAHEDVIEPINKLLDLDWGLRVFTADNHPHNHVSFGTNYPSYQPVVANGPFPIIELSYSAHTKASSPKLCGAENKERYGDAGALCNGFPTGNGEVFTSDINVPQETYPPHCVQGTWGQKIHANLSFSYSNPNDHLVFKGQNAHIDSYSAVFNNLACNGAVTMDPDSGEPNSLTCIPKQEPYPQETSLPDLLRLSGVKHVYFVGLCQDYCVKYSSIHTAFLGATSGWDTYVIEDATRACSPSAFHVSQSLQQMVDSGVKIVKMSHVIP